MLKFCFFFFFKKKKFLLLIVNISFKKNHFLSPIVQQIISFVIPHDIRL